MNRRHTKKLFDTFPNLYAGKDELITQNLMSFGFECRDGWFQLIWDLSEKLEKLNVKAVQVKEKYGTLRFYVESASDEAFVLIDEAEKKSATICELCGKPGELNDGPWFVTMCDDCTNNVENNRK